MRFFHCQAVLLPDHGLRGAGTSLKVRAQVAEELPDLIRRHQTAHDAMKEKTFSGSLRKAIQRSKILLPDLSARAEVAMGAIADFLTGEKTLPSDAIDRLVRILKLQLPTSQPRGP
jgi:hypothetical protein